MKYTHILVGIVLGWLTVGMLFACEGWTTYERSEILHYLKLIESHCRTMAE